MGKESVALPLPGSQVFTYLGTLCTNLSANVFIEAQINTYITNHMMFRCWATRVDININPQGLCVREAAVSPQRMRGSGEERCKSCLFYPLDALTT